MDQRPWGRLEGRKGDTSVRTWIQLVTSLCGARLVFGEKHTATVVRGPFQG